MPQKEASVTDVVYLGVGDTAIVFPIAFPSVNDIGIAILILDNKMPAVVLRMVYKDL
jgi:hypothetical protein